MSAYPGETTWHAGDLPPDRGAARRSRSRRAPQPRDYLLFLLVLPLFIAAWLAVLGVRPAGETGFWSAFSYIAVRVLLAWWASHLGALVARRLLRGWSVRLWLLLLAGFLIIWLPVTLLFQLHGQLLGTWFPATAGGITHREFVLSGDYLLHFFSRSVLLFLPVWMAVVHGYRRQFGVDWYACSAETTADQAGRQPAAADPLQPGRRPAFMQYSRLGPDARIQTLKAAEHYLEVVSDRGTDLVRYRFNDALREMEALNLGCQVHRSWWVSWESIVDTVRRGRSLELILRDGRQVPVSLTYQNAFSTQYRRNKGTRLD